MRKSSAVDARKVQTEYEVGVIIGSIRRFARRNKGVDVDINVGSVL